MATMTNVARQPNWLPIMVPRGTPTTVATVRPDVTRAMARRAVQGCDGNGDADRGRHAQAGAQRHQHARSQYRENPVERRQADADDKAGQRKVSTSLRSKLLSVTARIGEPRA